LGQMLEPSHAQAYWGVAYMNYLDGEYALFNCPSSKWYWSQWDVRTDTDLKAFKHSDYGFNGFLCWEPPADPLARVYTPGKGVRRITEYSRVSETIVLHDSPEAVLDNNGDMYAVNSRYDKNGENLTQHKNIEVQGHDNIAAANWAGMFRENWRHGSYGSQDGRGSSNILWLDGHVSNQKATTGDDFDYRWYTGFRPELRRPR